MSHGNKLPPLPADAVHLLRRCGSIDLMPPIADMLTFALLPFACVVMALYYTTGRTGRKPLPLPSLAVGSAMAATVCAFLLVFLPNEAYYLGLKGIVPLVLLWLLFPFLAWNILPGIAGPSLGSPLAYLQRRFDGRAAIPATMAFACMEE